MPERVVTNSEFEHRLETTDEWIRSRTGIGERRIAADHETTLDLAESAARRALQSASLEAEDVDLIVVGTTTPDLTFPSVGCLLQARLRCRTIPAFDVNAACTGFLYGLALADAQVRAGDVETALVVGAETLSRMVDWDDRSTCVLFGDGAGAVVLQASEQPGVLASRMHSDGSFAELLRGSGGVSRGADKRFFGGSVIQMRGREIFKIAVTKLGELVDQTLADAQIGREELDWLVPHQANLRIINAIAQRLALPPEQVVVTVERHGNTSAASVPLALDEAIRDGRIKPGQTFLMEAFGGGLTWASALVRL